MPDHQAAYDVETGALTGYFHERDTAPEPFILLSEEQWAAAIAAHANVVRDGALVREEPVVPLEELKRERHDEIDRLLAAKLEAGLGYAGKVIQLRDQDQQNVIGALAHANDSIGGGMPWPPTFAWRTADDSPLPLPDPHDMQALARACQMRVLQLRGVSWAHKDNVKALTDPEAVAGYNITAGW